MLLALVLACSGSDPSETATDPTTTPSAALTGDSGDTSETVDSRDTRPVDSVGASTTADTAIDSTAGTADTGECDGVGCVVGYTSLGSFDRATLQAVVDPRVQLTTGYEVFVVDYLTDAGGPSPVVATGTITLPIDPLDGVPTDGWPVVLNAHGTIGVADDCRLSGTVSGSGLAGLFGGRGAIGVAPDYIGLGGPGDHHYLDLRDEAHAVLDGLRAAEHLAQLLGTPTSGRHAVVGLSQGGHATLAAATWHSRYAPELDIRAFAASGPASLYAEQWATGVLYPGAHMALHALAAWSFTNKAGEDPAPLWASGFDPVPHLTSRCGWDPAFTGDATLYDDFPQVASSVFSADYLDAYTSLSFTGFEAVAEGFEANRIRPWLDEGDQTAPIRIWQGDLDAVVPLWTTSQLVDDLSKGGIDVSMTVVPGGEHTTTAFGFVASYELATEESVAWVLDQVQ